MNVTCCGLRLRTWDNLWVTALLAILLKVLALPMAGTLNELSLEQLLAGSYCSLGGAKPVVLDKDAASNPALSAASHCCCVPGGPVPLLPILVLLRTSPLVLLANITSLTTWRSPRYCWPSTNPRASPKPIV